MVVPPLKHMVVCFLQNRFPKAATTLKSLTTKSAKSVAEMNDFVSPKSQLSSFAGENDCGLPLKTIELDERDKVRVNSIISFLKSRGFTEVHIARLIEKYPKVLHSRLSATLKPKIDYIAESGFAGSLLPEILLLDPHILRKGLNTQLKPAFELLRKYLVTNERILMALQRGPWLLVSDVVKMVQSNIDYLIKQGVPMNRIAELLMLQPRCLYQDMERMVYGVETVRRLGMEPDAPRFIRALQVILSMKESTWKKKLSVFQSLGWSYEDTVSAFLRYPFCLACSEEKLRSGMSFLVNTGKVEPETVIAYPDLLYYSVSKRMIPRYNVVSILASQNLLKEFKFAWVLRLSEKDFIANYITKYSAEVPNLLEIYNGSKSKGEIAV